MRQIRDMQKMTIAALCCVLIINISTVFSISGISSLAFLLSIAITFVFLVLYILLMRKISSVFFFSLVVPVVCVLSNHLSMSFDYYRKLLLYIVAVSYFFLLLYVPVNKKTLRWMKVTSYTISILYLLAYFIFDVRTVMAGGITLNFTNPNFAAMWLLCTALIMLVYALRAERSVDKFICYSISVGLVYLMYLTLARATLIAIAFFLALVIYSKLRNKFRFSKLMLLFILLIPIIASGIYLYMCQNNTIRQVFYFLESEGKTVTSRYWIWTYAVEMIKGSILFGDYFNVTGGTGLSQLHNTHLDILASYGVVSFTLFVAQMYMVLQRLQSEIKSSHQMIAFIGFLSILIAGTFEGALFAGSMGFNYLVGNLIILTRSELKI